MEFSPCYRSPICSLSAVVYLQHMCCKAVCGSQLCSVKKCERKAAAHVSLVLQQKTKPCTNSVWVLSPAPTGIILPGEVSTLPKEHMLWLIVIPEFYIGHLGWRNMTLSLSSVSAEISTEWRPTLVCRRQPWDGLGRMMRVSYGRSICQGKFKYQKPFSQHEYMKYLAAGIRCSC